MTAQPDPDVRLDVPADSRYLQLLRVTAATAASAFAKDYRAIDDLRLAVDELAVALITAAPPGRRLFVTMAPEATGITLTGRVAADGDVPVLSDVGKMLMDGMRCSYRFERAGEDLAFEMIMPF